MGNRIMNGGAAFLLVVVGLVGGCGEDTVAPSIRGERGESCQARNDCEEGLACLNNRCLQNEFPIAVTAKQCDLVECAADEDCCQNVQTNPSCLSFETSCDAGDELACQNFENVCQCRLSCEEGRCTVGSQCEMDSDCPSGMCDAQQCVQCREDSDCGSLQCIAGVCDRGCVNDEECPLLSACEEGECVDVGCQSDRECVAILGDLRATCADEECTIPCENDGECDEFQVCQAQSCVFVGCETDSECRAFLNVAGQADVKAVCRE